MRLSTTEKALNEANARATSLNSRIALVETDARIKVQDLQAKVGGCSVDQMIVQDVICSLFAERIPIQPVRIPPLRVD